jgi:hypothetical protein
LVAYLSICWRVSTTKGAGHDNDQLLVLQTGLVIFFHAANFGGKNSTKHILHYVGIVAGSTCLCGKENSGLDPPGIEGLVHPIVHLHYAA